MSHAPMILSIYSLLVFLAQLSLGIMAVKINRIAGWMMILSAGIAMLSKTTTTVAGGATPGADSYFFLLLVVFPALGYSLFLAGIFMILLQAKAIKKRAEEQQMLLDDITSRS